MSDNPKLSEPGSELIGRQIGQYEIVRELGRGGMATVYLANQINMARQVAIKILPREFLHDPQFIQRFKREVQLIAELEHPHILPVYDFGEHDRIPYIVMRYLGGGSLLDMLSQGLPPLADLQHPIEQVCNALDFAHAEGIIHRDLKPSNIMLDERGNAYLSDFGIAQIMQDAGRLTGSAVIGTPAYMSPEQAEGRPLDARSDVYALGVVLFEMVTGREPFQADTPMAMLLKQITEPMPSPRMYRPDLPTSVEQVILRATLKDPAGRYPAASAFAAAFTEALRNLTPEQGGARLPRPPATQLTRPAQSAPPRPAAVQADENQQTFVGEQAPAYAPPPEPVIPPVVATYTPTRPMVESETRVASSQPAGRRWLWIGLAAVVVVVLGLVALALSGGGQPAAPTLTPLPAALAGGNTYRGPDNVYQVTLPADWQRQDLSTTGAPAALWMDPAGDAYVALHVLPAGENASTADQAGAYGRAVFGDATRFVPIDQAAQPDNSLRISYRVPQPETLYDRFGQGQLDLFYERAGSYFTVIEVFTADGANLGALMPILQGVLDSVVVDARNGAGTSS